MWTFVRGVLAAVVVVVLIVAVHVGFFVYVAIRRLKGQR